MKIDIRTRTEQLCKLFGYTKNDDIQESESNLVDIFRFPFNQSVGNEEIVRLQKSLPEFEYSQSEDDEVKENVNFAYNIFVPKEVRKSSKAIVLLHGLNERSWKKYLVWAEQLAVSTHTPVILFPIAFHMNRTPMSWCNPRCTIQWLARRQAMVNDLTDCSFANVTLSSRISESPLRFYISGKETCYNLWQLFSQIHRGEHPLFDKGTTVNLFGYSIGAMIAQVMMIANPDGLLSSSRLFIFMGGSIFSKMNGKARDIIDMKTQETLRNFYVNDFVEKGNSSYLFGDQFEKAFIMLLMPDYMQHEREKVFARLSNRIHAVTMKKDSVMTTEGAIEAFGLANSMLILEELDFPFNYSHQVPFPSDNKTSAEQVASAFDSIFNRAANFFTEPSMAVI